MAPVFKSQIQGSDEISLSKVIDIFAKRWHYILIFLAISLFFSWLYLRYTKPMYQAKGTIRVADNNNTFRSLGILKGFDNYTDNIQTEIQIIQSRRIVKAALSRMDVGVSYYQVGTLLTSELYKDSPFKVEFNPEQAKIPYNLLFSLVSLGGNKFELSYPQGDQEIKKEYYFGEKIMVREFEFQIFKVEARSRKMAKDNIYKFTINSI